MTITNIIDIREIKEELVVFLRNSGAIPLATRGALNTTEEFNGDNSTVDFIVSNLNVKNIKSVTVDAVAQTFGTDYSVDYTTGTITFTSAPASGTNNVDIDYDYGVDKIYSDTPRVDLKISSYPRVTVEITSSVTDDLGLGGNAQLTDFLISISVYDDSGIDVDDYIKAIRDAVMEAKKGFYYLKYVTPVTTSPMINDPARGDKIMQRTLEIRSPFNEEVIT